MMDFSSKISSVATNIMKMKIYEKVSQEDDSLIWMNHPANSNRQTKSGWLRKQGGRVKSWQRRWFVLNGDCLFYFNKEDDLKALGTIYLPGNKIIQHPANTDEPDKFTMEIVPGRVPQKMAPNHETFLLCAASDEERQDWVKVIRKVMFASIGGAIFGSRLEEVMEFERSRSDREVPYIVEACIEFLTKYALEQEGIFRLPGRMLLVRDMKDRFDEGESINLDYDEVDVHSVASLLKQYLRELPECLIPYKFYQEFMNIAMKFQDSKNADDKQGLVQSLQNLMVDLPRNNYNLLKHLCRFLSKVASYTSINKMTVLNLATVFGPNIIRHPQMDDNPEVFMLTTADISQQLAYMLIEYSDQIFTMTYDSSSSAVAVDDLLNLGNDDVSTGSVLQPMKPTPVPRGKRSSGMNDLTNIVFEQRGDRRARSFQSDAVLIEAGLPATPSKAPGLDLKLNEPLPTSPKSADSSPVTMHQPSFTDNGKPIPPIRRKNLRKKNLAGSASLDSTASSEYSGSERSLSSLGDETDSRTDSTNEDIKKQVSDTDNTPNTVILELQQKLETMNAEYEYLQERYNHLNASKCKSDERVKSLSSQMSKVQSRYDDHIKSLETKHQGQVDDLCQKLDEERSRLDQALKKVVELQTRVKDYELNYGSIKNELPPLYQ